MLCIWGSITFEAGLVGHFDEQRGASYAEHALIGRKPKLQCVGDSLRTFALRLNLHFMNSGQPNTADSKMLLDTITDAVNSHKVQSFSWGDGNYEGEFIGESIDLEREMTDSKGVLLSASYTLRLREYANNAKQKTKAAAVKANADKSLAKKITGISAKITGSAVAKKIAATAAQIVRQGS